MSRISSSFKFWSTLCSSGILLLIVSSSNFFSTLLELLGGGTGGVFLLGGLEGPAPEGLGVLGGVGHGLVLGVNTNAAGILTVFSDF